MGGGDHIYIYIYMSKTIQNSMNKHPTKGWGTIQAMELLYLLGLLGHAIDLPLGIVLEDSTDSMMWLWVKIWGTPLGLVRVYVKGFLIVH